MSGMAREMLNSWMKLARIRRIEASIVVGFGCDS